MFGLTAAHAAGSIAMLLVGLEIAKNGSSEQIVTNDVLNGVVVMILITCVLASFVTQSASQKMVVTDNMISNEPSNNIDDERILIPVKYPECADSLLGLALLIRNPKLKRELIATQSWYMMNADVATNQAKGKPAY